jgi:uncharacterized transporter YbjL
MEDKVHVQLIKTVSTLITTAFALIAGLAWNEAIKAIITEFLDADSAVIGLIIYALIVTIIAVVVTLFIGKTLAKMNIENNDK